MAQEMTAEEAVELGKKLGFPAVWTSLLKLGERVDKTTENIDKLGERIDALTANTAANIDRIGERIDRVTANIERMGERIDRVTANTAANIERMGERIDALTANVDRMGERVDRVTANVDRMSARVDRVTANVDKMSARVDRVTANVGGLNLSMGELVETLFGPNLGDKFDVYNYNLRRLFRRLPIYDDANRLRGEIDILLSNTTVCMAVEIKRWLDKTSQVDEHIKRMQLIHDYTPAEAKGKRLLGAIAAAAVDPCAREYAEQSGFFILELGGEDVRLLQPPEGFKPKEW
ncbi:MAG: methyl-accepting chemotaxis protein [Spirochaetaceae bacterium]|jgi:uncharacterized protein YoxC|nr:methyl-accepting chemotaxis protein [Spirochaetaceae bacterium]